MSKKMTGVNLLGRLLGTVLGTIGDGFPFPARCRFVRFQQALVRDGQIPSDDQYPGIANQRILSIRFPHSALAAAIQ